MNKPFYMSNPPWNNLHGWLPGQIRIAKDRCGFTAEHVWNTFRPRLNMLWQTGKLRREISDRDLTEAINFIFGTRGNQGTRAVAAPMAFDPVNGWPANVVVPNKERDESLIAKALRESPVKTVGQVPLSSGAVSSLFQPGDLLCVGRSAKDYFVLPVEEIDARAANLQFIVPNPLRKRTGTTLNGRQTCHCRNAVGDRRFIVVENDTGASADDQVAILFWLASETETNLRAIVSSGGKSVHGWFDIAGVPPTDLFDWFVNCAIPLGADPRLFVPEQFVRMPGGMRDNGNRQQTLYLK